jgi:hypothetical protein
MFFSPKGSKVCLWVLSRDLWINDVRAWLGVSHPTSDSVHGRAIVVDADTGQECAQLSGFRSAIYFADETTIAALSEAGDAIQLWDLPPRTALPAFIAWACLGVALVLTMAWWSSWRAVKKEIGESTAAAKHST